MGWFESQIEERRRADDARLDMALRRLSDAVTGGHTAESGSSAERAATALDRVLAYYGVEPSEEPPSRTASLTEMIRDRLRSTGIMSRPVRLTGAWWKDAMGAMLGFDAEGEPVALVPGVRGGYERVDATGRTRVGERAAADLREEAYCFYRPLPQRELSVRDLLLFMVRAVDPSDYIALALATLAVTLLGLVAPLVNEFVFGPVVTAGDVGVVGPVAAMLAGVLLAQVVIGGVRQIVLSRISTRVEVPLEAAVMIRVLSLPASFFSRWQTSELASRVEMVTSLAAMLREIILTAGFNSLFSLVYVGQIASVTPSLALPALGVLVASAAVTVVVALAQMRTMRRQLDIGTRLSGWQLALLQGIQKIRLAGAEKRAFSTWADIYQGSVRLTYNGPVLAHRVSTIKNCGRVVVIDGGQIVEDGTYDELLAQGGVFAELVARQQV